ncbi:hypothetical protein L1987_06236 [Smallanthus sonchifolius]|uniref:Uncharacterized protein n=1 Tax=Smallanthus sonchifolius TaxID=185202 RepID=A0ACB9JXR9_9ASTR|nr:hypothetical protein L1987_06236 [Smallanthus sonchifolius]
MDKLESDECEEMFESFALAEHQQPSTRTSIPSARAPASSPRVVHQVTTNTSVAVTLAAMANEIKELKLSALRCEGGPSSGPNASVMSVSIISHREEERIEEEAYHGADYGIPSVEEVKKIFWRAQFTEIDARMLEETKLNSVSTRKVLQHMSKYGKFLKDLLSNKKKLEGVSKVSLSEQCSAVLDLGELQPTRMSISLADRAVKYPPANLSSLWILLFWESHTPCGDEMITFDAMKSVKNVGEHSHFVCMLDAFVDYHQDSNPEREVDEHAPYLEEPSDWAVELEELLDAPDDYGDEIPSDM